MTAPRSVTRSDVLSRLDDMADELKSLVAQLREEVEQYDDPTRETGTSSGGSTG